MPTKRPINTSRAIGHIRDVLHLLRTEPLPLIVYLSPLGAVSHYPLELADLGLTHAELEAQLICRLDELT